MRHLRRRAFTLVEMVAAAAITAIILAACVSAVLLAAKAIPDPSDAVSGSISAARITDQIAGELENATLITEQTATSLAFNVPPRGNDSSPERIRYSWSGVAGAPLLRQYNRSAAASVIDRVYQFSVTPTVATSTETYGGVATEDATESLLVDYTSASGPRDQNVSSNNWQGQYFCPASLPTAVVGWRPTRVMFQAKQSSLVGITNVQMLSADANMCPAGSVLEQYMLAGTGLLASYAWQSVSFTQLSRLAPSTGVCLVLRGT